ncbi:ABC transporter ATP-binding protein [Neptunicoccus sediminis]|uniref:ABC transporter ATP-binding protein n=1 Tax=Neptunicoccus sediminis TaxID=1892596 RepID=UPI0009F63752|nr:ABC transporter ATP-binding protein [Neptunicoccus sediminis]
MALVLEGVSKVVNGQTHIHPTNLELQSGTMNVLLGPTLAGKTSLMRLMAGLDVPNTGKVFWDGKDVTGMRVQDRGVAMVYQQFINYPSMTVYENIASPMRLLGKSAAEIDAAVKKAADLMKLSEMLDRKPLELSGGQQQRCALARALVKDAGLVLLDEPLANLDYKLREELRAEIPKIFEEAGSIFVYATTEPEEALLLGGNTATMWEGRITQFDKTPIVYRQPVDATTARVFSDPPMNFLKIRKSGDTLHFGDGQSAGSAGFAALPDGDYMAGFRPNHLELENSGSATLEFTGTLQVKEITGSETFVHLDHHGENWVGLIHGVKDLEIGAALKVFLDPRHVYIFAQDGTSVAPAAYATETQSDMHTQTPTALEGLNHG